MSDKKPTRLEIARKIKASKDFKLPRLKYWNYDPCEHHETARADCEYRKCGGDLFSHQNVSISWLYTIKNGLDASSPGTGKAQPLTAKVLTPTGWIKMGDLSVGDLVYTPDRKPVKVLGIYPQGLQPIYKITMADGASTRATGDHLWKVTRGKGDWSICTTDYIREHMGRGSMFSVPSTLVPNVGFRRRYIKHITPDGWEEAQCISIDSEEQLYLTDDYIVTHNTNVVLGLLCLLKQQNEMPRRGIVVVNTPAVKQWEAEAKRFAPGLRVAAVVGGTPKKKRIEIYGGSWDVLIVGYHIMTRDLELLKKINPTILVTDDVDPILNHDTLCHKSVVELSEKADRVIVANASSIAVDITQIHSSMMPIGGRYIWGPLALFEKTYVQKEWERVKIGSTTYVDKQGRTVHKDNYVSQSKVRGIINGKQLRKKLDPWYIRHTYDDISDVKMPEIAPVTNVWLDLLPEQRKRYDELRAGVLKMIKDNGEENISEVDALQRFLRGQQIAAGLSVLGDPDGPGKSVKFDWLCKKMLTDWKDEKVICFVRNKKAIRALQQRFDKMEVGHAEVTGNKVGDERQAEITRFWQDPNCRIIFCSAAGVRSLNLQCARIVCFLDIPSLNPESVHQAIGRARRAGGHSRVYPFFLLCNNTQEDKYEEVLQQRETISRWVWDSSDHILPKMSSQEILQMILP